MNIEGDYSGADIQCDQDSVPHQKVVECGMEISFHIV